MLAEAKSEILRHQYRADPAENDIRVARRQIEPQAIKIGQTIARYEPSIRELVLFHKELADRERALHDFRITSTHEMEELKRAQELRVDEFSRGKLIDNQNTINELKAKAQELKNEVKCMEDPREYKDAESVRSGRSTHVPSELALFPFPTEPRGLLSRDRNPQPDILNTYGITGNVFANSPAYSSTPYSRMVNLRNVLATGNIF